MPFVRNVVAQWQPRNCDPMVDFLDSWAPIIPVWILDNILDQLIFPKLQKEVGQSSHTASLTAYATRLQGQKGSINTLVSYSINSSLFRSTPFLPSSKGNLFPQYLW